MRIRKPTTTITLLCNHMLLCHLNPHFYQVRSLSSLFSTKHHFFTTTSFQRPLSPSSSSSSYRDQTSTTHIDTSSITPPGLAKLVVLTCSHLWEEKRKKKINKGETFVTNPSLKDLLLRISDLSPEVTRRFRRFSELKPEHVLEMLLGFDFQCENLAIETRKVETLWEIFKWAYKQSRDFEHVPRSCEVMASMLLQMGLLREVEFLLSTVESRGILLDSHEIFSNLIEGYVGAGDFDKAVSVYGQMRGRGLIPSLLYYRVLLDHLVQMGDTRLALQVLEDMVEVGLRFSDAEKAVFVKVVRLLCMDGRIQEARNVIKKVVTLGIEPCDEVVNELVSGYCEKKDFEDALSFFLETRRAPDVLVGNKILFSLCSNFGTERAEMFMRALERLGFCPDETTFGILIGWSCREGKLKGAFTYLSEIMSRGLKPDLCSYNALICGLFEEGMWKHARNIFLEMVDVGVMPDLSTFRVLLAGYCKARQFSEVKVMVSEMMSHGLIQLLSPEDPLSKAFMILGLNPVAVRVKRDNHVGFSKTEFFDDLGNGLYLETDLEEYEKIVTGVLENSMIPDFNSLVMKECSHGNLKTALVMVEQMARWGQELSLTALSALVKAFCAFCFHIKAITNLLDKMPKLANQLDAETLNLLFQTYCRKGLVYNGKIILDRMLQRRLTIENRSFATFVMCLCKKGNSKDLQGCWDLLQKDKWLPGLEDCKALVACLCQQEMLKEALELLESMLVTYPHLRSEICDVFLEKLCAAGYTSTACVLVEKLLHQGCILYHTSYCHLIRGFIKEKQFSEAFMVLDIMLSKHLAPCLDVSAMLISQLCRTDKIEKAIALSEICLKELSSSLSVYAALMTGFCKTGKVGVAGNLFQVMLSKGLLPDTEIYNLLVQGHCQANNISKVGELLSIMIKWNFSLSISSYRSLVRLMCMKGRALQALGVKKLMLRETDSSFLIIYNFLIFYLLSMGNTLLVNALLDELKEKAVLLDEVTYNFLVYGFSQSGDVSSSVQCLTTMISRELKPSNRSMRAVISCLCDDGELKKALELSHEMELRGWVLGSVVQNVIVEGLLSHGKLQEAENFLDRMVEKGLIPNNINYDNLIKRFCWYGRLNKAVDLLNVMLRKGNVPNSTSYDSVIQGFCTYNKLERPKDFYIEMMDRNLRPNMNTWDVLVHKFCRDGRTAEAEKLLISMVQLGETPTKEMYCSVINGYRFENNLNKASEILQAMQRLGYHPDFETHWSLISNLSNSNEDNGNNSQGFLSGLLSKSGFAREQDSKAKLG